MKKSKVIIISAVALVIVASAVFIGLRFSIETAAYLKTPTGSGVYISEKTNSPVVMLGDAKIIGKLATGDKIIVVHDKAIMLSYPAQTNVYLCVKTKSNYKKINSDAYPQLAELGWIENDSIANEVSFKHSRTRIPENWKSEDMLMTGHYYCDRDVKIISPKEEYENGYMLFAHYSKNSFNVNKSGLSEKEITLANGMLAKVGYYEGNEDWNYVNIFDSDGYVFENKGLNHEDSLTALEIIKSTTFS